jgi:mannosyltransferase
MSDPTVAVDGVARIADGPTVAGPGGGPATSEREPDRSPIVPDPRRAPSSPGGPRRGWLRWGSLGLGLGIAVASSVWQLGRRPLWIDEAISLGATNQLWRTIRGTGGTMALYYVLLDGWTAVAGTDPVALRTLSLLLVLAALAVAWAALHRLLPGPEAALAIVVTAALPGIVRMAQDARSYALLTLVVVACWWCAVRAVEESCRPGGRDRRARAWLLALVPLAAAGVATQGLFLLHLVPVVAGLALLPRRRWLLTWALPGAATGIGATCVLVAIGADDVGDWIPPLSAEQAGAAARTLVGGPGWVVAVVGVLAGCGVVLAASRARSATDPVGRWRALVPVLWAAVPALLLLGLSTVRPTFLGRYLLPSVPALGALVAVALGGLWQSAVAPRPRVARVVAAVAVTGVLVAALVAGRVERGRTGYEDWDAVVAFVAAEARPGDGLIFPYATDQAHPDTVRAPFEAAWSRVEDPPVVPVALSPARPLGEVRRFDDLVDPEVLAEVMVDHPRVWAVEFPGFHASLKHQMTIEPAASQFRNVGVTVFGGGIQVVLLERVPA